MTRPPSLKTAMTPFPHEIGVDALLAEAEQLMAEHGVHHLAVTEAHRLVGLISQRDIIQARAAGATPTLVREIYVPEPYVVDLEQPIETVLLTMAERHIGSALVTRQGRLAGLFTWVDACRACGEYFRAVLRRGDGDDAA